MLNIMRGRGTEFVSIPCTSEGTLPRGLLSGMHLYINFDTNLSSQQNFQDISEGWKITDLVTLLVFMNSEYDTSSVQE
jgi:hypothetical protein